MAQHRKQGTTRGRQYDNGIDDVLKRAVWAIAADRAQHKLDRKQASNAARAEAGR